VRLCYMVSLHGRSLAFQCMEFSLVLIKSPITPTTNGTFCKCKSTSPPNPPTCGDISTAPTSTFVMSSSTPTSPHISSHPPRSRASSDISVISPHLLHRPRTGRIQRNQSNSSRVLSLRNQEAIWEAATERNWAQDDSNQSPAPSLTDSIPPLSLSVPDFYTESDSPLSLPPLRSLPELESSPSLVEASSTAPEGEVIRDALWYDSKQLPDLPKTTLSGNSMEFMMPPQYNHFGSYSSNYQSSRQS
jgi:hypothetical protein